ncbi:MAG: histidinol-phosphatase HisJ family protein [Lachnospiraceae bacterium]|nr:histidinol-phosphatase HisJ family protein [Lachnospiraceae bacterium]
MFADYHVHTEFSDDSVYPMEQVIRDAIAMGMDEICFTDHVDYGIKEDWDCGHNAFSGSGSESCKRTCSISYRGDIPLANVDYPVYAAKIKEFQQTYGAQIAIKFGLEFGVQMHTIPQYEALFRRYPFDFIILSIHQVEDLEFWTQDFQHGKSQQEYNERYYEEMLNVVKAYHDYSVLGHMDLITRYDENGVYPFEKVEPVISEILKTVIADGKGIEFNTSYHRYGLKDTTPSVDILKLYRRLGGEIITIGSDSHEPEHLGAYVGEAKRLLHSLGFRFICTFDRMEPVFHRLCE